MVTESYLKGFDFGNEAGDDEAPDILSSYFVKISAFDDFLMPSHRLFITTAKKGVGKSALLNWASYNIEKKNEQFVIKCTGAELTRSQFNLNSQLETANDYIRDWMVRICSFINRKLAARCEIALSDDRISLIESAEIEGFKSRNIIGCLVDHFSKILGNKQPEKLRVKNEY